MSFKKFYDFFRFSRKLAGYIGVEREQWIVNPYNMPMPYAKKVLDRLGHVKYGSFTDELSQCIVEYRTNPCPTVRMLGRDLKSGLDTLECALSDMYPSGVIRDRYLDFSPVGDPRMPLEISSGRRYQAIRDDHNVNQIYAAVRIIGTHVHVGMPNAETALRVYNGIVRDKWFMERLYKVGDRSDGERLRLYKEMAEHWEARPYFSWRTFFWDAKKKKFAHDPRSNYALVRIHPLGTIEFRMFDAMESIGQICVIAKMCQQRCMQTM